MEKDCNPTGVGVLQQICCSVAMAVFVKDGPTHLCPIHVVVGEAVVGQDAHLDEPISDGGLPLQDWGFEGDEPLDPLVGAVDEAAVPAGGADEGGAGAGVEAGVEAASAAEDSGSGVDDAVLGDEALGGGGGGEVGEGVAEVDKVGDVLVSVGRVASFQEEDFGV